MRPNDLKRQADAQLPSQAGAKRKDFGSRQPGKSSNKQELHNDRYYIRILKLKLVKHCLTVVLTIATDLGESSYPHAQQLAVEICSKAKTQTETAEWAGTHAVQTIKVNDVAQDRDIVVHVRPVPQDHYISACSQPSAGALDQQTTRHVAGLDLIESTRETIASHVWDGGVLLAERIAGGQELEKADRVLELGTGVGLVGLAIAKRHPGAQITLTDLEAARGLVEANISANNIRQCTFEALDWEAPRGVADLDWIVMADVTYNSSYHASLLATVAKLKEASPQARLLFASKNRHVDELAFMGALRDRYTLIAEHVYTSLGELVQGDLKIGHVQILQLQ
ncbi:putative methyltransferase-domain-containing protein [Protomyces lactucae-debilis]|uniref:Putative methyltransferase-domain-containing protein n=1 Tax=Protomyces lactucae-debilis TaxID=2754530 RepID=A0A1Y2F918_PROLT|nr:putative methyltransferase-domain-containing protein [Protomyces lactucae-debilis]ORY80408.1 putative methyltransferase-domain-containing protein [Protomyces lactucae-debilis]